MEFEGFRTSLDDYFKLSGIRENRKLSHHPFVVFDELKWKKEAKAEIARIKKFSPLWEKDIPDLYETEIRNKERLETELKKRGVRIRIVDSAAALLNYPDSTEVIAQWGGEWSSDFFKFCVKDLKDYIANNPKQSYHQV